MTATPAGGPPPIRIRSLNDAFDYGIHQLLRATPIPIASAVGAAMGAYAGRFTLGRLTARADAELARLRPDLSAEERARLLRFRWRHIGRCYTEFSHLHRLVPTGRVEVVGAEHLTMPGPRLLIGPHIGNWEVPGPTVIPYTGAIQGPYTPPSNNIRHAIAYAARMRYGAKIAPPGRSAAMIVARALSRGGIAAFYTDEVTNGRRQGPSFDGPPAPDGNIAAAARVAYRYGAAIIPGGNLRLSGARYRMVYEEPIIPDTSAPEAEERERLAALINARTLAMVKAHPEQWYMLHERPRDDYR